MFLPYCVLRVYNRVDSLAFIKSCESALINVHTYSEDKCEVTKESVVHCLVPPIASVQ